MKFLNNHTAFVWAIVIGMFLSVFSSALHAQTAPSTYSAYAGTDTKTIPQAPVLGPANSVIKDPTFGSQILRVTDPNTNSGESFISTDAGFHRAWNANSTAIKLTGPHGDGYWLDFNPGTFTVGDGSFTPVIHPVPFGATWEWSTLDPDIIYFLHGNQIGQYNKSTGAITDLGGPPNGDAVTYMAVVIGQDNWVCAAAGSGAQNNYTEIFCVNPISPSVSKFVDVLNKTINGVVSADPNWPVSASGQTIGIHDISGGTGASWLEITFHGNSWGADGGAVFDLGTNTWSEVTNTDPYWSGHVSMGNGKYANSAGSIDGRDSRGMLVRNPETLMSSSSYLFVGQPPTTLNQWCDADHNSWLNSMSNPNAPILISRYTIVTPCQYAWTGEIDAAAVDGSNIVWRFAHNHNGGNVCYYAESFAQISNDGRWALFSSYWDGALGSDTSFGCSTRIDTFIVDLFSAGSSSDSGTPLAIATTSLASGTQNLFYSASLAATGGGAPYTWSITSGSLPAGLSLASGSGAISGTPTGSGTTTFTVQVADSSTQKATATLILTINPPPLVVTTTSLPSGTQNAAYSAIASATGGTTPYTWSVVSGSLPAGLSLASSSGAISGTPTGSGTSTFTVQAADANAQKTSATLSLTINPPPLAVTTTSLPSGTQNAAYSATASAAGGTPPYTWSVVSGSLPAGLSLASSSGAISGTPTGSGTSTFTVQVADANAQKATATLALTVSATNTVTFTRVEQTNPSVKYVGNWYTIKNAVLSGGSAVQAIDAGSGATFTFTGTIARWVGYKDPWSGIAKVYVDGIFQTQIDTYSAAQQSQVTVYTTPTLTPGTHTLTVTVTGTRAAHAKSSWIWVDAFETNGTAGGTSGNGSPTFTRVEQTSSSIQYTGTWYTINNAVLSGGSAVQAIDPGNRATLTFTGTVARWIGFKDPWSGIAKMYVDGVLQTQIDTYSAAQQAQSIVYTTPTLTSGTHTLTVEVTDTHSASAQSSWVWVDAFEVAP